MSLAPLNDSPTRIRNKVQAEVRSVLRQSKVYGSKDDIADHLFDFAQTCIGLRFAIYKSIEMDNLMHRKMAEAVAAGKRPTVSLDEWENAITGAMTTFGSAIKRYIRLWKQHSLDDKYKRMFGFGVDRLIEAEKAARDFLDALRD